MTLTRSGAPFQRKAWSSVPKRLAKKEKLPLSPGQQVAKVLFILLTALSALVLILFVGFKLLASQAPRITEEQPPLAAQPEGADSSPSPQESAAPTRQRKEYTYTFLLCASDQASGNVDTMIVATYDTVNQTLAMVSIPRDTLIEGVSSKGKHFYKLCSMYPYNGIEALKEEVRNIVGFPIDFYVKVNTQGFVKLVDAVGGVNFNVPVHMAYDDPAQDLHIHYEPGLQHLDGQDVLNVARCRKNSDGEGTYPNNIYSAYPDNDIGRTRTQQQLIATILKKALSNPQKINSYIEIFLEYVNTNLEFGEMLWFAQPALGFDFENGITTQTLTGNGNTYYPGWGQYCYQLYPEETLETVNQLINPYDQDLTLEDMNIFQYS